jgi:hypothetical protein
MYDDAAARREARKLVLTRIAGDAAANSTTPSFAASFDAAVGASIAPTRA